MEDLIKSFLSIGSGYGSGYGSGDGSGSGSGSGYGSGDGSGSGDGYGSGYGSGDGDGYGDGYGYGSGYGSGDGDGYGDGYGDGISTYNGAAVYRIDGVQTLIAHVRGNAARGHILNSALTLTSCFIVKQDGRFAHGASLHEAQAALLEKLFDDMPEEERIAAFVEAHKPGVKYSHQDYFSWHHRLTGSCEMGRRQFARDHGLDLDSGEKTPEEFIRLTSGEYGGSVIKKLIAFYPEAKDD